MSGWIVNLIDIKEALCRERDSLHWLSDVNSSWGCVGGMVWKKSLWMHHDLTYLMGVSYISWNLNICKLDAGYSVKFTNSDLSLISINR